MDKFISIIVPIFRVEDAIERCANSLFCQTYSDIEYIFVDDASDDKSVEILKKVIDKYPCKKPLCKIIRHDSNKGLVAARNTGLSNATGEYIWHVDGDDEIASDAVASLADIALKENSDIVLFNAVEVIGKKRHQIKNTCPDSVETETFLTLTRQKRFELCFRLVRRKLYEELPIDFSISMGEDWASTPRLSSKAKIISYLDKDCYFYYRNIKSMTGSITLTSVKSLLLAYDVLYEFFSETKYVKFLTISAAFLKIHLLKMSRHSNETFNYVFQDVFKDIQCHRHEMSMPNRIILTLNNAHMLWLTKKYIDITCKISQIVNK